MIRKSGPNSIMRSPERVIAIVKGPKGRRIIAPEVKKRSLLQRLFKGERPC